MTVSLRIAGKIIHVSSSPARAGGADVSNTAILRGLRTDHAAMHGLRRLLGAEAGAALQRITDAQVVEEVVRRVAMGRWTLAVVEAPRMEAASLLNAAQQGPKSGGGGGGSKEPLKEGKKTWVEVELLDRNKRPVRGLAVELTLPDGSIQRGTLSDKGSYRKDGIDPGTCKLRFPDLDGREWAKSGAFAEGAAVELFRGAPKIGPGPYTVKQGDHIASIAAGAGFLSWKTIWDDGKNGAIKGKRNPNVLYPGDKLEIPAKQKREENVPTGEYATFQTIGDPVQLKIVVLDWAGNPVTDAELDVLLGANEKIKTAGDGSALKKFVDPLGPKEGKLKVQGYELGLKLGHLDPVEELSGQVWRLNNLGYRAGNAEDEKDPNFLSAVEEFQCDQGLKVDGKCGPATQSKLKDAHGS